MLQITLFSSRAGNLAVAVLVSLIALHEIGPYQRDHRCAAATCLLAIMLSMPSAVSWLWLRPGGAPPHTFLALIVMYRSMAPVLTGSLCAAVCYLLLLWLQVGRFASHAAL
jgi:hypothetical protein